MGNGVDIGIGIDNDSSNTSDIGVDIVLQFDK